MHLFYTPEFELNEGEYYSLNKEESTHCIKVLRLREKDTICLTNGLGRFVFAEISDANPKNCSFVVTKVKDEYMKTEEFYNKLSDGNADWKYMKNDYPDLNIPILTKTEKSVTEITVENIKSNYEITTEIMPDENGEYNGL